MRKPKPKRDKNGRFKAVRGTTITKKGYIRITAGPQRGMYLHRLLAAFKLGRPLKKDEDAHHVNGKKLDFSFDNLKVMGHREHGCVSAKQHFYVQQHEIKVKSEWDEYFEQETNGGAAMLAFREARRGAFYPLRVVAFAVLALRKERWGPRPEVNKMLHLDGAFVVTLTGCIQGSISLIN